MPLGLPTPVLTYGDQRQTTESAPIACAPVVQNQSRHATSADFIIAVRGLVCVEALTALAAEVSGSYHFAEERAWTVLRIAETVV